MLRNIACGSHPLDDLSSLVACSLSCSVPSVFSRLDGLCYILTLHIRDCLLRAPEHTCTVTCIHRHVNTL